MSEELRGLGVTEDAISGILAVMAVRDVADLQQMLGDDTEVRAALKEDFRLQFKRGRACVASTQAGGGRRVPRSLWSLDAFPCPVHLAFELVRTHPLRVRTLSGEGERLQRDSNCLRCQSVPP